MYSEKIVEERLALAREEFGFSCDYSSVEEVDSYNARLLREGKFALDDKRYFTLRVEAFNVLNHPNFAVQAGSMDISNPATFGRIQNTFSAPRIVEIVGKFTY